MTILQKQTILLSLCLLFYGPLRSKASCVYKAVGETFVIPLDDVNEDMIRDGSLTWTQNETRVYLKRGSNKKKTIYNIDTKGSLILNNLQIIHSGKYTAEVYDKDGKLHKKAETQLCVRDPVSDPTVTVKCEENKAILTCQSSNTETTVIWMKNGREKLNVTNTNLHLNISEFNPGDQFSCTFRNEISEKTSKQVQPECFHTGSHDSDEENTNTENTNDESSTKSYLFGLDLWWMLVCLTGGGIVMLILICIVCVFRSRKKTREEEEFRLTGLVSDQSDPKNKRSERISKSQRPLPPVPSPLCPSSDTPPYM